MNIKKLVYNRDIGNLYIYINLYMLDIFTIMFLSVTHDISHSITQVLYAELHKLSGLGMVWESLFELTL